MENEPKKISFGFSKLMKKPNIVLNKEPVKATENKVQLIDCLEEKSIKVVGGNVSVNKGPLIIPMKQPNKKLVNLVDLVKNNFVETIEDNGNVQSETNKTENEINTSQLSLEEQAALELLNGSKKTEKKEDDKRIIEVDKDKFVIEGEKESSLDDYEDVPIEEFGKAMLRGMGWKDGCGIGKNEKLVKVVQPAIRPKGMGLGADKITKQDPNNKPAVDRDGKVLKCVKRAYIKIIAGYHKGSYGQIMGLDDESGRFIIKTAINNLNISLNEFLVVPVTKEEYNKNSKIINNVKYEEYMKKKEEEEKRALEKEKSKKYDSEDENYKKKASRIKKERKSESSDAEEGTSKREETYRKYKNDKIKKEQYSDSDNDTYKSKRKEDKYRRKDDYEERKYKQKYYDDKEESRTKSRDRKNKYDSDEEYKRDRKGREKKSKKYSSDVSDSENEDDKKYKKSSKHDEDYSKKKHKKKKSKKYSSDESDDDRYKRKSKKSDKKYYSDSEDEDKRSKSHKRDKKDRSRYDK